MNIFYPHDCVALLEFTDNTTLIKPNNSVRSALRRRTERESILDLKPNEGIIRSLSIRHSPIYFVPLMKSSMNWIDIIKLKTKSCHCLWSVIVLVTISCYCSAYLIVEMNQNWDVHLVITHVVHRSYLKT